MASTNFGPPLELDLGNNPGRLIFHTVEEPAAWARKELERWQAAIGAPLTLPDGGQSLLHEAVATAQLNRLSSLVGVLANAQGANKETTRNAVTNAINELFLPRGTPPTPLVVHSDSIEGRQIVDAKPASVLPMLALKLGLPVVVTNRQSRSVDLTSFIDGQLALRFPDPDGLLASARGALETQAKDWQERVSAQRALYERSNADVEAALGTFSNRISASETRFQRIARAAVSVATKQRDDHSIEMGAIRKRFEEEMRLRGPVGYWDKKRESDSFNAWIIGVIFIVALAAIFVATVKVAVPEIDRMIAEAGAASSGADPGSGSSVYLTHLKIIVAIGIPAFLAFWILRIMSRLFHLNLSGAVDAGERVTMVQTYLALYGEKKLEEADRILILQALFRPTSQTADDSPPPNWFDILMQRMKTP